MKSFNAGAMVLLAPLALTPAASAQDAPPAYTMVPRLQLGATAGATAAYPDVGVRASMVVDPRVSLELAAAWMPHRWRSPALVLTQAQVRVPPRSRVTPRVGVAFVWHPGGGR